MFQRLAHSLPQRATYLGTTRRFPRTMALPRRPRSFIGKFAKANPVLMAGSTVSLRYIFGDIIVQLWVEDPENFDIRRSLMFGLFGFGYASTVGYRVYNVIYPTFRISPLMLSIGDCLFQMPLVYFPIFYIAREAINSDGKVVVTQPLAVVKTALLKYKENFVSDAIVATKFWLPLHWFNFRFVPLHFRQPFMGMIGFAWAAIMSSMRGSDTSTIEPPSINDKDIILTNAATVLKT